MNEQEKSLKLAELCPDIWAFWKPEKDWNPYSESINGLAQFAAILLKFPEVMCSLVPITYFDADEDERKSLRKTMNYNGPTQANILDEILRMNGVEID